MHSFIKNLILDNLTFEIHFNEYYAPNGVRYFVVARERYGDSYCFNMKKQTDEWRIINAPIVQDLFLNNEKKLSDAIMDHQKDHKR
ncbi:MAG TPA: hypothetical protein VNS32_03900 [Flavisolibacter sp.]|nr:hypothetical protein [Flavisolibacter sp.]